MIEKYDGNPVIRPEDVKPSREGYRVLGAFNPGAVAFGDEILLLLRVAEGCVEEPGRACAPIYRFGETSSYPDIVDFDENDPDLSLKDTRGILYKGKDYLTSMSHIRLARSTDGLNFTIDDDPFLFPVDESEQYGLEDARVTRIEGRYYINYSIVSADSWCTALSVTDDFENLERLGIIFHPENKDVALFPEKVNGKYIALHRPNNSGFGKASIWYAESPDLLHWGAHKCIARPRDNRLESKKIGGGGPPIKTDEGWLIIYHGKGEGGYCLITLLLDLNKPSKVLRRGEQPILTPTEECEVEGFFGNVVFSNGVVEKDGRIYIYYGASDEFSCVAMAEVEDLLASC